MYYPSIKMLDIELENFARIKSGMGGINKLSIDFTKHDETIYLFIGDNGSGKTSTMQCFHPFAFNNSSGDSGLNGELITVGMDGRKQIRYGFHDHVYTIVHLYTRKKDDSLSVKSYIQEDDIELNPTGSVNIFKDWIERLFGLKESYLTVLSIGNTMSGFVKFTAGERKNFAVKIFRELQEYPNYYKNASNLVREIKPLLNNVSRKLEQYRDYDIDDFTKVVKRLDLEIGKLEEDLEDVTIQSGKLNQQLETNRSLIEDYEGKEKRVHELFELITAKQSQLSNKDSEEELLKKIQEAEESLTNTKVNVAALEQNIQLELQSKDSDSMTIEMMKKNAQKIASNADVHELVELKARLESELSNLNIADIIRPKYTSSELVKATIYLDELHGNCVDLLSNVTHLELIPDVVERYHKEVYLSKQLQAKYDSMVEALDETRLADSQRSLIDKLANSKKMKKCECDNMDKCPYVSFYNQVMSTIEKSTEKVKIEVEDRERDLSITRDLVEICRILTKLYQYVDNHIKNFALPEQIFNRNSFVNLYMEDREVYNKPLMSSVTKLVTDFERSDELKRQISDVQVKIDQLDKTRDAYISIQSEIERLEKQLDKSEKSLDYYRRSHETFVAEQEKIELKIKRYRKDLEIVQDMNNLRLEMKVLKEELSVMDGRMRDIQSVLHESAVYKKEADRIRLELTGVRNKRQELIETINNYTSLTEEQRKLSEMLDQRITIQKAVSPSQGIPIEIISDFMKGELLMEVNERLQKVYHGRLKLDIKHSIIDENEFTIPYTWDGTFVKDISKASDGQKAILTLAFSITLIKMITQLEEDSFYNIMLMDEMDTTLDNHGRSMFIEMLEDFATEIHASQIFTISHNQMFDGYPVVILMTSDYVVSNSMRSNVIRLYKGGNM